MPCKHLPHYHPIAIVDSASGEPHQLGGPCLEPPAERVEIQDAGPYLTEEQVLWPLALNDQSMDNQKFAETPVPLLKAY